MFSSFVSLIIALCFSVGVAVAGPASGVDFDPAKAVPVEAFLSHDALAPDATTDLAIVFHVPEGYHITDLKYGMFYAEADTTTYLRLDAIRYPAGILDHEELVYRGDVTVFSEVTLLEETTQQQDWTLYVGYQICSEFGDLTCYMPVDKEIQLVVPVVAKAKDREAQHAEIFGEALEVAPEGLEGRLQKALMSGSWIAFLLVFIGGILSSLTPCVYPLIPITISFIGGRSKGKLHGFIQSLFFVGGMALVYSSLGIVAALGGGSFGAIGQSVVVQSVIAVIFLIFAAGMFGAFEMQLPSSISEKMQSGDRSGPWGAVLMGAVTGFIAAPCVGPIIAALLVFIASTQSVVLGFFLMLSYALGMGVLFLIIGTFAGAMNALPGAGGWMETVKKFFGVVMVAMAIYFLREVIPAEMMPWLAGFGLVIFAVFSGAFFPVNEDSDGASKFYKAVGLIAFIIALRFLIWGFSDPSGTILLGSSAQIENAQQSELSWEVSSPDSDLHADWMAQAKESGQPLIIDFWATWCAQCRELDHETWTDPAVFEEGQRFRRIKMDMTKSETPWAKSQNAAFKVVGMPTVIFIDGQGQEQKRFVGFKSAEKVLQIMKTIS
jgi:thioredoxin:protein disulfide reductase